MVIDSDVFICYAGLDRPLARDLAAGARAAGLSVFIDCDDLRPGDLWDVVIPAALERARMVVVLVTARWRVGQWHGEHRPWYGPEEVARAIRRHRYRDGVRIVPVLADAAVADAVPYGLDRAVPIVVEAGDWAAVGQKLAATLAGRPTPAPAPPEPADLLRGVPMPLIECLAENFPDVATARALWRRAGGAARNVENLPRPMDLWQRLWQASRQGAAARPDALLRAALEELPHNPVLVEYLAAVERLPR